jgi:hypothetical protein
MDVFNGSKYCPTLLETVDLYVPNDNFRDFSLFNVTLKVETAVLLTALWQKMPSTVHSVDVWLVSSTFITSFTNCLNL